MPLSNVSVNPRSAALAATAPLSGGRSVRPGIPAALFTTNSLVMALLLAAVFVAVFWFFFLQQHRFSAGSPDWSHAYMVPLISGYLLWQNRREIMAVKPQVFWPGLIPLVMSIPCYLLFQIGSLATHMGEGWAMILGLFGLVLFLTGPRMIQPLFMPIAYLVFGVTVAEMIMINLTFLLQGIAAQGGWALLSLLQVNTDLQGHTLIVYDSAGAPIPLNIAQACSGMRMVIAFAALGVAVALLSLRHWWQRVALILLGLPVAVFINIVRVAVLGILSLSNPQFAKGQAHMMIGLVLLVAAFFIFLGIAWALRKTVSDEPAPKGAPATTAYRAEPINLRKIFSPGVVTALCVLVVSAAAMNGVLAAMGVYLKKLPIQAPDNRVVAAVPKETEHWIAVGRDEQLSEEMVEELGTKNSLTRSYTQKNADGKQSAVISLHLAYYTGMIDTVPHVPDRCMTAAGMQPVRLAEERPVPLDHTGWKVDPDAPGAAPLYQVALDGTYSDAPGKTVRLPRGIENLQARFSTFDLGNGAVAVAGYFFIANGGLTPSPEGVRLLAFKLDDDYAYYLKVQTNIAGAVDAAEAARLSGELLSDLLPEICRCAPDWVEVQRGVYPSDNPRKKKTP